jgi:hypothetical protein
VSLAVERLTRRGPCPAAGPYKILRHVLVTNTDQHAAEALICGYAIELREVQPSGSHTYPTPSRPFLITVNRASSPDQADPALATFEPKTLALGFSSATAGPGQSPGKPGTPATSRPASPM